MVFAVKKGLFASRTFSLLMATPAEKFKLKVSKLSKLSESIKHMPGLFLVVFGQTTICHLSCWHQKIITVLKCLIEITAIQFLMWYQRSF